MNKNSKWKQSMVFTLVSVLLITLIGCSAKTDSADQASKTPGATGDTATTKPSASTEPVTISMFGGVNSGALQKAFQEDDVMLELQKRTGVKIDFTSNLNVADPAQKMAIMLAGKDLPDIVIFNALTDRDKVINSNQALPLDDLVAKLGPDIQKNAAEALKISKLMNSDATHSLYYLPGGVGQVQFNPLVNDNAWNLRWDLYKQLNYPKLDTLDDLLNVLEQMMKLEPTNKDGKKNYGLGLNLSDDWGQLMIDKAIANMQGKVQASYNDWYLDMDTNKMIPRISDPNSIFWKSMKFYNQAYQRGILDPESATLKFNALTDKYKTGRYFASTTNWSLGGADKQFAADGHPEKGYVPFMIDNNKTNIYVAQATLTGSQFEMFISKNAKNPEAAMKFINYLYSYEGTELLHNGIEGKHYDMVNGIPIVKDTEIQANQSDPNHYLQTGVGKYAHVERFLPVQDPKGFPVDFLNVPETVKKLATPAEKEFMDHYQYQTVNEAFTKIPNYSYDTSLMSTISAPAGSDTQAKKELLDAYLVANIAKAIYQKNDKDFETAKAKFIEDYKAKGASEVLNYFITNYDKLMTEIKK
jgi:putative aldouronate transport system substrate-binding protein